MSPTAIIAKKRDCQELSGDEIRFMVDGFVAGAIPEYQIAAWAMAILCRGMNEGEIADLTDAMLNSGIRLQLATQRPRVDKHSTGGLGDKVSLILAPLLACFEVDVPMLSGRGLGITGGTLDKLESYTGFRCDLTVAEISTQLQELGCVITGTTPEITPADRKLYSLRDVTGTVPSVALITSSIMSKKLAASLDALVLDVKYGSGAFMQNLEDARSLANSLVSTGRRMHLATRVILSDMNQPLGRMVGNACEANESVEVMQGGGPPDLVELTLRLSAELLVAVQRFDELGTAIEALKRTLSSGRALEKYEAMISAQGGTFSTRLPTAAAYTLESPGAGWLGKLDGQLLGQAVIGLGGGRTRLNDPVDPAVGLEMLVRIGDRVESNQPILRVFARTQANYERAQKMLLSALQFSETPIEATRLIAEI